jgi:hypothetical protein
MERLKSKARALLAQIIAATLSGRRTGRECPQADLFEIQPLENRLLLTTFTALMSAPPTGVHNTSYTVDLYTTGGTASQWVVHWGDGLTDTYSSSNFAIPYPATHTYGSAGNYTITGTATKTGTSTTSTAYFGLSDAFGTLSFQQSGRTSFTPNGASGDARGEAMVVDHSGSGSSTNGDIYVAGRYGTQFGITRFTSSGLVDTTGWGNQGTLVLPHFLTGTDTDIPYAMDIADDGQHIAVVGKDSSGWAVAIVDITLNQNKGDKLWQDALNISGQANAVTLDHEDPGDILVAGTDGTHMVIVELDENTGDLKTDSFGTTGIITLSMGECTTSGANTIIETKELDDQYVVGGYTNYCSGSAYASDFTLVKLDVSGNLISSFGTGGVVRTNIGCCLGAACASCRPSTTDSVYSLVEWNDTAHSKWYVTAAGASNATGSDHFILARYDEDSGSINTSFGTNSGITVGPAGVAYSAIAADATSGKIIVGGSSSGSDFLVARFGSNGLVDNDFGNAGMLSTDFGAASGSSNTTDVARSVCLETDGSILLGGYTTSGSSSSIALADYLPKKYVVIS